MEVTEIGEPIAHRDRDPVLVTNPPLNDAAYGNIYQNYTISH
mgnify:CR=1 FL=1